MMRRKGLLSILIVGFFICHPWKAFCQESPCATAQCERLVNVYALAIFYPNRFVNYVQQERAVLSSGSFNQYIQSIANAFIRGAINQAPRDEVYNRAMDVAARAGAPELGPKVADDMMQSQGNYALVGIALQQLSQVLRGQLAYESTYLYQTAAQLQMMKQLWDQLGGEFEYAGFWNEYMEVMFELTRWYMGYFINSIQ